ncbi:MAG: phytoene desaturase, partial [Ignavibacteria bacterium]|nr:phytoene desaturase [Ignavibacteria bacterium]
GEDPAEYLTIKKLDNLCRYFYTDGTVLNAWPDINKFAAEIESKTTDTKDNLYRYLEYCKTIYDLTADIFLFGDLYSASTYTNSKALKTLFKLPKIDSMRTMNEANRSFFKDERIIQLFNRYATYNGSDPYQCPATLNIISHVEYSIGGYFAEGGMFSLTNALYKLAEKIGVRFRFNTPVTKIVTEGKKVTGIQTSEGFIKSDIVISNADVYSTYGNLLGDTKTRAAKKYNRLEPSSSALVFYMGVEIESKNLEAHNILFSADYKKEFDELFSKKILPSDPTIYIYISSKFAPGDAPKGMENWFVMINAPNSSGPGGVTRASVEETRKVILEKIKAVTGYDITGKIRYESVMTPNDIEEQTGSWKGSIYGISSNNRKAAFLRQPNRSRHYKGLYFAGGSAHPGGGIPLVILSGKLAAELVMKQKLAS